MSQDTSIPFGLCQCGCEQPTKIAPRTVRERNWVRGQPMFRLLGHNARPKPELVNGPTIQPGDIVVPLTKGFYAVIDPQDAERVLAHSWCVAERDNRLYGQSRVIVPGQSSRQLVYLHRFILDAPDDVLVDHEDREGLNCRRSNLRFASHADNTQNQAIRSDNRSGYRGVSWSRTEQCWTVSIAANNHRKYIGRFADLVEAAKAYDAVARELHGEFARLNFPEGGLS